MRDIKFRCYYKSKMYDIKTILFITKDVEIKNIGIVGFDDIKLMQYTGLKDKNGVEIYEGDILKVNFDINKISDELYISLEEKERRNGFIIKIVNVPEIYQEPLSNDYEVIGNIYENPDLVGGELC